MHESSRLVSSARKLDEVHAGRLKAEDGLLRLLGRETLQFEVCASVTDKVGCERLLTPSEKSAELILMLMMNLVSGTRARMASVISNSKRERFSKLPPYLSVRWFTRPLRNCERR